MSDKLLRCRVKKPACKVRLFCFPWSGTGPLAFNPWNKLLSDNVELVGVMLPGRETRYKEPCCQSAKDIATQVAGAIHEKYADKPIFFCGHSFGALLCQEVAATLQENYDMQPSKMYVSGESPPHSRHRLMIFMMNTAATPKPRTEPESLHQAKERNNFKTMGDEEMTDYVVKLGSLPLHVKTNLEILKVLLPTFRVDLAMVDEIKYDVPQRLLQNPLSCPIMYLEAVEDMTFDIQGWKQLTSGTFTVKKFVGSHLYLKDPHNQKLICDLINADATAL